MSKPIVCYNGTPDSGGTGSCNTPPCGIGPVGLAAGKYFVGGFPVILEGDVLTPAPGTTPGGNPCATPRTAISTSTKVFFGGRRVCRVGAVLGTSGGTPITATMASSPGGGAKFFAM